MTSASIKPIIIIKLSLKHFNSFRRPVEIIRSQCRDPAGKIAEKISANLGFRFELSVFYIAPFEFSIQDTVYIRHYITLLTVIVTKNNS